MNELVNLKNTQVVSSPIDSSLSMLFEFDSNGIQLNDIEQKAVAVNFNSGLYIVAAEVIWRRTIDILKSRLAAFGEEFIGDMLGYSGPKYADDLSEIEAIDLNCAIGYIRQNARMELIHHSEQIKNYTSRQYQMIEKVSLSKAQATALIEDCIKFVLSDMTETTMLEFNNVREQLKTVLLQADSEFIKQLQQEQYFAKRTILRSLMNLAKTDKEEEKQFVFHNMDIVIPEIWVDLAEADKYDFGSAYAEISNTEKKDYINVVKKILFNVHGFDYVPENLKSNSFKGIAKNLLSVHEGVNNFYNEPLAAKLLASMGSMIPDPAIFDCMNAILICLTGNAYGVSDGAQPYLNTLLNGLTTPKWELYLKDLPRNIVMMQQLGFVKGPNDPVQRWCLEIKKRDLGRMYFENQWIVEFVGRSAAMEYEAVRKMAQMQYSSLNTTITI